MNKELLLEKFILRLKKKDKEWWNQLAKNDSWLYEELMECVEYYFKAKIPSTLVGLNEITFNDLEKCCNEANPDYDFHNNITKAIIPRTLNSIQEYIRNNE